MAEGKRRCSVEITNVEKDSETPVWCSQDDICALYMLISQEGRLRRPWMPQPRSAVLVHLIMFSATGASKNSYWLVDNSAAAPPTEAPVLRLRQDNRRDRNCDGGWSSWTTDTKGLLPGENIPSPSTVIVWRAHPEPHLVKPPAWRVPEGAATRHKLMRNLTSHEF